MIWSKSHEQFFQTHVEPQNVMDEPIEEKAIPTVKSLI